MTSTKKDVIKSCACEQLPSWGRNPQEKKTTICNGEKPERLPGKNCSAMFRTYVPQNNHVNGTSLDKHTQNMGHQTAEETSPKETILNINVDAQGKNP